MVDCSTVNPSFSKLLATEAARRRVRFLDAPVTGSAPVAAEGKLVFWVGGEGSDVEKIRPLLLCAVFIFQAQKNGERKLSSRVSIDLDAEGSAFGLC